MNKKLLIDRFLSWPLPESLCSDPCASMPGYPHRTGTNLMTAEHAAAMIEHVIAAPRRPEGDAISRERVQAEADAFFDWPTADKSSVTTTSCLIFARCIAGIVAAERDATIAELREELQQAYRQVSSECHDWAREYELRKEVQAERNTLRQQLAERDAEIERLRVQLLAIFSAEPGRHNIEWAKAMAATGNNEAYAKWREAFDQRDKLAGLLREVRVIVAREVERWTRAAAIFPVNANVEPGLLTRIDAALAELRNDLAIELLLEVSASSVTRIQPG